MSLEGLFLIETLKMGIIYTLPFFPSKKALKHFKGPYITHEVINILMQNLFENLFTPKRP